MPTLSSEVIPAEDLMSDIASHNMEKLKMQRQAYDVLIEEHEIMDAQDETKVENEDGFLVTKKKTEDDEDAHAEGNGEEGGNEATATTDQTQATEKVDDDPLSSPQASDPLTAIVQEKEKIERRREELDLKYRKEKAKRKFGVSGGRAIQDEDETDRLDTYSSKLTLGIIEKDLLRLHPEHHTYHHSRMNYRSQHSSLQEQDEEGGEASFEASCKQRTKLLTEILLVYAKENPETGYRQGMHEICSYLLLALEMDLFDQESNSVEMSDIVREDSLQADTYHMLAAIMQGLKPAYDIKSGATSKSPMETMASSILNKIRDVAGDKNLYDYLKAIQCPPELYCTRWVRLMFSREVSGWSNVLLLWDVLFDLISVENGMTSMPPSKYTRPGVNPTLRLGRFPLMQVLEAAAASMILLQRQKLLTSEDTNESIHILMNVKPLPNILPLTATLLSVMRRIQLYEAGELPSPSSSSPSQRKSSFSMAGSSLMQMATNSLKSLNLSDPSLPTAPGLAPNGMSSPAASAATNHSTSGSSSWGGYLRGTRSRSSSSSLSKTQTTSNATTSTNSHPLAAAGEASNGTTNHAPDLTYTDMATMLNNGLSTIRQYLTDLDAAKENASSGAVNNGSPRSRKPVPQSVWDAISEVERVRQAIEASSSK